MFHVLHNERKISIMTYLFFFFFTSQGGKKIRQLDDNVVVVSWDIVAGKSVIC